MQPRIAHALPPIQTFGKLESTFRAIRPSDGSGTDSITNTVEVGATSYIWEPWFGTWNAIGAVSRSDTSADTDSSSDIFTGDAQVNLFHRSHFPLSAFVGLRDSRLEIGNLSQTTSNLRTLRLGVIQQYQDVANAAYYRGSYHRDEQDDLTNDETAINQRLLFTADKTGERHRFAGVASLDESTNTLGNSEFTTTQGLFSHVYTPNSRLTVSSNANASSLNGDSDTTNVEATRWQLGSLADWRPSDEWRLRGELRMAQEETDDKLTGSNSLDRYEARASARYEISDQASVFADLDYDLEVRDESSTTRTSQRLSGVYDSQPIPWRQFNYTWNAGAGVGHESESGGDNVYSQDLSLGHNVSRVWTPVLGRPVPIVFSAGQDGRVRNETDEDTEFSLTHRATANGNYAGEAGITSGYVSAFDIRTFGRSDLQTFSLIAGLTQSRALTRYKSIDLAGNYNYNATSSGGVSSETDVATLELNYRDGRLFDVNRLTFESRLRAGINNVIVSGDSGTADEIEWENEVDYRIGLLEINSRLLLTANEERHTWLFYLSITRRF
jgi:hypothetical protein